MPAPSSRVRRALLLVVVASMIGAGAAACTSSDTPVTTNTSGPTSSGAPGTTAAKATGSTPPGTAGGANGTAAPTTTERAGTTTTTKGGSTSSTASPSSSTTAGGSASTVATTPVDKAFCAKSDELIGVIADMDFEHDPAGALRAIQAAYDQLVAVAPPEIAADITLINNIVQAAKTFEELGNSDSPELNAAGQRLDTWAESHCGHRLNGKD
jgi:hypothetical protein